MKNFMQIAEHHAQHYTSKKAWTFLDDNGLESSSYTFRELYESFNRIGSTLRRTNMQGERVLILLPPGADFSLAFFGIMFGLAIPVPSYFIDPKYLRRGLPRLKEIIRASQTTLIVTTSALAQVLSPLLSVLNIYRKATQGSRDSGKLRVTTVKDLIKGDFEPHSWSMVDDNAPALLQFTSGSTGNPKGVIITQRNIMAFVEFTTSDTQYDHTYSGVSWLPPYHDFGLIGSLCLFFATGNSSYFMSPLTFLKKPHLWLKTIAACSGPVISCSPPFALNFAARKIKDTDIEGIDLSNWKRLILGAEPIRSEVLDRFAQKLLPYGFNPGIYSPGYGLAETTLAVSGKVGLEPPKVLRVSTKIFNEGMITLTDDPGCEATLVVEAGTVVTDHDVIIVDPNGRYELRSDRIGELWVHGPCVARGYWNEPEKSLETFGNQLKDDPHGKKYLRTGDLGFKYEGRLYITGRLKEVIIINGANYYPQDIEHVVQSSNRIFRAGCGAASRVIRDGLEGFIIAQEVKPEGQHAELGELASGIRSALSETIGISPWDIYLIRSGSLPKTSSGKIQRVQLQQMISNKELVVLHHCRDFAEA